MSANAELYIFTSFDWHPWLLRTSQCVPWLMGDLFIIRMKNLSCRSKFSCMAKALECNPAMLG